MSLKGADADDVGIVRQVRWPGLSTLNSQLSSYSSQLWTLSWIGPARSWGSFLFLERPNTQQHPQFVPAHPFLGDLSVLDAKDGNGVPSHGLPLHVERSES